MPKKDAKTIQKEIESHKIWPVYWLYGPERMKIRELVKRIRSAVIPDADSTPMGRHLSEAVLDGDDIVPARVHEEATTLSLMGGPRFVVIRGAEKLKPSDDAFEVIKSLIGPPQNPTDISSVCVFVSENLDQRLKLSKLVIEKAACVECSEVGLNDRDTWIRYLAQRRQMNVSESLASRLAVMEPFTLDGVDQELEKDQVCALYPESYSAPGADPASLSPQNHVQVDTDRFVDFLFGRQVENALSCVSHIATDPDIQFPLLGLIAWNLRQLIEPAPPRLPPHLADKFRSWKRLWTPAQCESLQKLLLTMDVEAKQTRKLALGSWTQLALASRIESAVNAQTFLE